MVIVSVRAQSRDEIGLRDRIRACRVRARIRELGPKVRVRVRLLVWAQFSS